ncbi:MAG TPA: ECF-type sigma factor [Candidatus Krumholzibacteria bacterium]|nr:ECF-type sigma factor [Candidatus Krumholzibacteria bacterium]HPD70202.1 ECF-type sigma factor [Candidatus Krumholzibacteria bacterium]HRY40098.1 ECF-type sigma factor [Candidatus Krumholzibacteria bacterium]
MDDRAHDVTRMFRQLDPADPDTTARLHELLYDELRRIAARRLSREQPGHTLQPTALVHEAYLRLFDSGAVDWRDRAHFLGFAARVMRQVLVDHARRRAAAKRGAGARRVTLSDDVLSDDGDGFDLFDVNDAVERLAALDAELGRMTELRFFGGLTLDETALVLGVSRRKVAKDWSFARLWLARELGGGG